MFTTDANVFGSREWDRRNYRAPGIRPCAPCWTCCATRAGCGRVRAAADCHGSATSSPSCRAGRPPPWAAARSSRSSWTPASAGRTSRGCATPGRGKLLVKGILSVDDAERAAGLGCDGIVLSNHGGRQLDSCVAPLEVLPQVAAAVGDAPHPHHRQRLPPRYRRGQGAGTRRARDHARPRNALRPGRRRRGRRRRMPCRSW